MHSISIADVDNDGQTEIVAGGKQSHGTPGVYVYIIDGSTGIVEWKSIHLGNSQSGVYALDTADIDNDGTMEIVAVNDSVFVIDGITHRQWQSMLRGCYGLALFDTDMDGIKEVIVGTESGNIIAFDGETYEEKFNIDIGSSRIAGLQVCDIIRGSGVEIIFASSGSLGVYNLKREKLLWQSKALGSSAGENNNIVVTDMDADKGIEVLAGTNYTVVQFESTTRSVGLVPDIYRLLLFDDPEEEDPCTGRPRECQ